MLQPSSTKHVHTAETSARQRRNRLLLASTRINADVAPADSAGGGRFTASQRWRNPRRLLFCPFEAATHLDVSLGTSTVSGRVRLVLALLGIHRRYVFLRHRASGRVAEPSCRLRESRRTRRRLRAPPRSPGRFADGRCGSYWTGTARRPNRWCSSPVADVGLFIHDRCGTAVDRTESTARGRLLNKRSSSSEPSVALGSGQ